MNMNMSYSSILTVHTILIVLVQQFPHDYTTNNQDWGTENAQNFDNRKNRIFVYILNDYPWTLICVYLIGKIYTLPELNWHNRTNKYLFYQINYAVGRKQICSGSIFEFDGWIDKLRKEGSKFLASNGSFRYPWIKGQQNRSKQKTKILSYSYARQLMTSASAYSHIEMPQVHEFFFLTRFLTHDSSAGCSAVKFAILTPTLEYENQMYNCNER